MRKYLAYRDSGVSWFGEIPEHWKLKRLKFLAEINPTKNLSKITKTSGEEVTFLPMENVSTEGVIDNSIKRKISEVWEGFTYFERNDVVIAKITPCFENGKGAYLSNLETEVGFGTTELIVLRANEELLPAFLYYVTKSFFFRKQGTDFMTGSAGQQRVPTSFVQNFPIGTPPLDEQRTIVDYLNRKLEKIDYFIANKVRLITLLQEQKTSLINRAVTRGINPDAQLKPSGISWLDSVPENWERKRAKFFFHEVDERSESGEEELLSVSHITGVTPRSEKNITMFMAESYEGYKTCRPGDLVINIMWAWMGALGVSEYQGIVSSAYGVYRQKNTNDFFAPYLDYLLRTKSYVAEFTCRSKGVTSSRARMYSDDFFDVSIVRPPHEEQVEIVQHIRRESATIDAAIAKAKQEIELIKEFRTVLISDCVTGKIDVSQVQAKVLPMPLKRAASPSVTPEFKRALLAAEIIYLQHQDPTFGRVKFQKTLHLCEYQIQIDELGSDYKREAAGPHDSRMLYQIESQLKKSKWFECVGIRNEQHRYIPLEKVETYKKYFERHWGERREAIHGMINLLKPLDSEQCEIVSTLYAAWNDLLLTKQAASDEAIIQEVMSWHESKLRIPEDRWRRALKWMRDHGLVPAGFGKPTHHLARKPSSKSKI